MTPRRRLPMFLPAVIAGIGFVAVLAPPLAASGQTDVATVYRGSVHVGTAADGHTLVIVVDTDADQHENVTFLLGIVDDSSAVFPHLSDGPAVVTSSNRRLSLRVAGRTHTFVVGSQMSTQAEVAGPTPIGALARYDGGHRAVGDAVRHYLAEIYRPIARRPGRL